MENDELKEMLIINFPKVEKNFDKVLDLCKKDRLTNKYKLNMILSMCVVALVFVFIFVIVTISIDKKLYNGKLNNNINDLNENAANVDRGKNPYLASEGINSVTYEALVANDPTYTPVFDKMIAWGPESLYGVSFNVIVNSNLLKESDKELLNNYKTSILKTYPNHEIKFDIAMGIKDDIDYIYLIDYCGWDKKIEKEVYNEFLFESNLDYKFSDVVSDFELLMGCELSSEFLSSSYYDEQNLLTSGIILGFIENSGFYQEYYLVKNNGEVFVINK